MARLQDLALGRKDMLMLDPRIINEKPGWNRRHEGPELDAHIRSLADSIKVSGVKKPLTVYLEDDKVFLADGHCRRRASLLAIQEGTEIMAVPCIVAQKGATPADLLADQIVHNSGKPFSPMEIADVAYELTGMGWTSEKIAERIGKTAEWIDKLLDLRAAPQPLTDAVKAGEVSATLAAELVSKKGGSGAAKAVAEAKERTGKAKVTKKDIEPAAKPSKPSIKALVEKIESCGFQCEAGVLASCQEWIDLRAALGLS